MNEVTYWKKTGHKFSGTTEEFNAKYADCKNQHAWTDEEGCFDSFLCLKDWKECNQDCCKHRPPIDNDFKGYIDELNRRLS